MSRSTVWIRALTVLTIATAILIDSAAGNAQIHAAHGRRFLIGVNVTADLDPRMIDVARDALQCAVRDRSEALLHLGDVGSAQRLLRAQHLSGHIFEATVRANQVREGIVRFAVSIVVSSMSGRVIEFESESAATVSSDPSSAELQATAIRRAIAEATNRSIDQLLASS